MAKLNEMINIKANRETKCEKNTDSDIGRNGPQRLTSEKLKEVSKVETIARYDDFSSLKIDKTLYRQEGKYGIPFKKSVHKTLEGARVSDYQRKAALRFLSELRGFGMLADCVGSGKTYEACVVISELAVRDCISNLLIVVPDEALLKKWKQVVEMQFGLGEGQLQVLDNLDVLMDGVSVYAQDARHSERIKKEGAFIMTYEAFESSRIGAIKSLLFDLIVVDEAHNWCKNTKEDSTAMYYLSLMMQTKKLFEKNYCLLLTATPHSGNLIQMFKLWYFIRCKGGVSACFLDHFDPSTLDPDEFKKYKEEKEYYEKTVCKGAKTVSEYVARAQSDFLSGLEMRESFFAAFKAGKHSFPKIDDDKKYEALMEVQKRDRVEAFLSLSEDIKNRAIASVKNSYTKQVMGSIMVRRKRNKDNKLERTAISYFFLPVDKRIEIDPEVLALKQPSGRKKPRIVFEGVDKNVELYRVEEGDKAIAVYGDELFKNNAHHKKEEDSDFYSRVFSAVFDDKRQDGDYLRVCQIPCDCKEEDDVVFAAKCDKFIELVRKIHAREGEHRMVVFFDYKKEENLEDENENATWKRLIEYLKTRGASDVLDCIIEGTYENIDATVAAYNANKDVILIAESLKFTEGQDLQKGNVVINFEVPNEPLTVDQRIGRVYREGQEQSGVEVYSFATMTQLEGYCLGYYVAIGILSDTDGDATILSGCNSDNMKVMRCSSCEDVTLWYESDYEEALPFCPDCGSGVKMRPVITKDPETGRIKELFVCVKNKAHTRTIEKDSCLRCKNCSGKDQPVLEPIMINEFVCERNPRHRITRASGKGYNYVCMSFKREVMTRTKDMDGNNLVGCSKLCALRNCPRKDDECALRKKLDLISTEEEAREICSRCKRFHSCDCRIDNGDREKDKPVAKSCAECGYIRAGSIFPCGVKPYTINFGTDFSDADCPLCSAQSRYSSSKLKQVASNTFETFVKKRYEHDRQFPHNFKREMDKTLDLKQVMEFSED